MTEFTPHPVYLHNHNAMVSALEDKAKGYSGNLKDILLTAAHIISEYGKEKPFQQHIIEHAHMFAAVGYEDAAKLADEMDASEVAEAIRAKSIEDPEEYKATDKMLGKDKSSRTPKIENGMSKFCGRPFEG